MINSTKYVKNKTKDKDMDRGIVINYEIVKRFHSGVVGHIRLASVTHFEF